MKKSILLLLIVGIPNFLVYSQVQSKKEKKVSLGLSFSTFGDDGIFYLYQDDSDPTFSSKSYYSLGISTFFKPKKYVKFESGIYYSYHLIVVDNPDSYYSNYYPDQKIALIEFPINIRFDLPYFYVTSGLLAGVELNNNHYLDDQTGIGLNLGLGLSYKFKCGILVYAGPVFYMNNFFPINEHKLSGRTLKIGISFN